MADDNIKSTLIGYHSHISLASKAQFRSHFERISLGCDEDEIEDLNAFLCYLMLETKMVPRQLINLARQNLLKYDGAFCLNTRIFNDDTYLSSSEYLRDHKVMHKIIMDMCLNVIEVLHCDPASKDYYYNLLYRFVHGIKNYLDGFPFSINDILALCGEEQKNYHLYPITEQELLIRLCEDMKAKKLLVLLTPSGFQSFEAGAYYQWKAYPDIVL